VFGRHREIWYSLIAMAAVTTVYATSYLLSGFLPRASGLIGHEIGIVGFVLMLMAETLYSIRKRRPDADWGSMANWLQFHIFTGLVGPYMVLLHTAMRFQGLAGIAMLLTVVVVASGIVGRYIFTTVPRAIDVAPPAEGAPAENVQTGRLARRRGALATWYSFHLPLTWVLFATAFVHAGAALVYATLQR
jgi:hypothetical protein